MRKVPRGFHQISTRILPGFHQVLRGLQGRVPPARRAPDEGSARVPPISSRVRRGPGKVPRGFHHGFTSGPGWFEVMFHENSTRIPPTFAR